MPVARGTQTGTPTPVVPLITRTRPDPPGTYEPVWYAPDGTVLPLNPPGTAFGSLKAVAGLGAVPVEHVTSANPDGGSIVEFTRVKERTIQWPLRWLSGTHLGLLTPLRQTIGLFTQTRDLGPGRLRITRPDGTAREIYALYSSGLEGDAGDGMWTEFTAVVNLFCPDPFWRAVTPVVEERRQDATADYLAPYPTLSSGQVFGATSVRNDGAADAWPTWTIRGPMTSLVATNTTRGQSFTLTHTLSVGQTITISSRPIQVRGPAGVNLINKLNLPTGKPWRLSPRTVNDVTFTVSGSAAETSPGADNGTMIRLEYVPRYETA